MIMARNFKDTPPYVWDSFFRHSVGFDRLFTHVERMRGVLPSYPPHDLIKTKEGYRIEMAIAGFSKEDLKIELKEDILSIAGQMQSSDKETEYLHKGIAERKFVKNFSLSEHADVSDITLLDGVLTIQIVINIPEKEKIKLLPIN
jgi:molecular chaperone IbpA